MPASSPRSTYQRRADRSRQAPDGRSPNKHAEGGDRGRRGFRLSGSVAARAGAEPDKCSNQRAISLSTVLILLPPSEGKAGGGGGPPVNLASLSWPALSKERGRIARVLSTMCQGNPITARKRLGLSEALDEDRAANAELLDSPTMPAGHRYCGVLHGALGYPTLPTAARKRADASVIIFSGLWGATRPTDLLPAYRIGIGTHLPRLPGLPAYWRKPLTKALDGLVADGGAIDLRSGGYSTMYAPTQPTAPRLVEVRITGPDGTRAAASYQSKVAKGRLAREMLIAGTPSVERLLHAAAQIGVTADCDASRVVVRLPAGWGLVGSATS